MVFFVFVLYCLNLVLSLVLFELFLVWILWKQTVYYHFRNGTPLVSILIDISPFRISPYYLFDN